MTFQKITFLIASALLSGGVGVGIYETTTKEQEETKTVPKIRKILSDSGFVVLDVNGDTNSSEWEALKTKNSETPVSSLKEKCKDLLDKDFNEDEITDYKEAAKKCTKVVTFNQRIDSWDLVTFSTETDKENKDEAELRKKFTEYKDDFGITEESADWKKLAEKCKEFASKNHFESDFQENWEKYIKACVKDGKNLVENLVDKSYWTMLEKSDDDDDSSSASQE